MSDKIGDTPGESTSLALRWQDERLFFSGDEFYDSLFREVAAARVSVEAETYIFENDAIGARAEKALEQAHRNGAVARLSVDGVGARPWIASGAKRLAMSGVEVRIFHPLWLFAALVPPGAPARPRAAARTTRVTTRVTTKVTALPRQAPVKDGGFLSLVNRRNHRKTWIIDGKIAYVGSLNIAASHSESLFGPQSWQDAAIRIEGDEISLLRGAFEHAWARARTLDGKNRWIERLKFKRAKGERLVRLNHTAMLRKRSYRDFLHRVRNARERVWIANPYLVPSPFVLRALKRAKAAGADVKVLVPRRSDVFFMRWVATAFYGPLARAGAEVHEYLPRFLHQKSTIIDGWATVGTSNMNTRSLLHDLEVDVVLSKPESVAALAKEYKALLMGAARVDQKARPWGWLTGFLGRAVALILKNWI